MQKTSVITLGHVIGRQMQKERRSHRDTFTKYSRVTESPEIGRDNCYGKAMKAIGKYLKV